MNLRQEMEIENVDSKINHILRGLINITHSHQCLPYVLNITTYNNQPSIVSYDYLIYLLYAKKKEINDIYNVLIANHAPKNRVHNFMSAFPLSDRIIDVLNTNFDFEHAFLVHQKAIEHYLFHDLPCPTKYSKTVSATPLTLPLFTYSKTILKNTLITSKNISNLIHRMFHNIANCPYCIKSCQAFLTLNSHYSNYFIANHSNLTQAGIGKIRKNIDNFSTLQKGSINELAKFYQKNSKNILQQL